MYRIALRRRETEHLGSPYLSGIVTKPIPLSHKGCKGRYLCKITYFQVKRTLLNLLSPPLLCATPIVITNWVHSDETKLTFLLIVLLILFNHAIKLYFQKKNNLVEQFFDSPLQISHLKNISTQLKCNTQYLNSPRKKLPSYELMT